MSALDKDFTAQYSTALADFHMFTYCDTTIEMSKLLQHISLAFGQMEECAYCCNHAYMYSFLLYIVKLVCTSRASLIHRELCSPSHVVT